eukprot:1160710-Pelagomonas_calceolata.AAC.1
MAYAPMALRTYHTWPLWHMPPWHCVPTTHGNYGICPHGTVYLPLMATMAYALMALLWYERSRRCVSTGRITSLIAGKQWQIMQSISKANAALGEAKHAKH